MGNQLTTQFFVFVVSLYLFACNSKHSPADPPQNIREEQEVMAERGPGEFRPNYRDSEEFFTMMSNPQDGFSPHGRFQTWFSKNIRELIEEDSFIVPVGTVSIKEFDNNGRPGVDGLAIMVKMEDGYDSENNNWYYEIRTLDGQVSTGAGRNQMCINCHKLGKKTDYFLGSKINN